MIHWILNLTPRFLSSFKQGYISISLIIPVVCSFHPPPCHPSTITAYRMPSSLLIVSTFRMFESMIMSQRVYYDITRVRTPWLATNQWRGKPQSPLSESRKTSSFLVDAFVTICLYSEEEIKKKKKITRLDRDGK